MVRFLFGRLWRLGHSQRGGEHKHQEDTSVKLHSISWCHCPVLGGCSCLVGSFALLNWQLRFAITQLIFNVVAAVVVVPVIVDLVSLSLRLVCCFLNLLLTC